MMDSVDHTNQMLSVFYFNQLWEREGIVLSQSLIFFFSKALSFHFFIEMKQGWVGG